MRLGLGFRVYPLLYDAMHTEKQQIKGNGARSSGEHLWSKCRFKICCVTSAHGGIQGAAAAGGQWCKGPQ